MNASVPVTVRRPETATRGDATIPFARARLARWLLEGGAQLTSGANAGGVAGWLDGAGSADYVYPEITGYYLQWLAWHATSDGITRELTDRAAAAQRWLASWIARSDPPQTRVYLRAHHPDWRNDATFFFDLAMVVRGLASAARADLIDVDAALVRALVARLSRLVEPDGMFAACAAVPGTPQPPARWSTRRGGFLAKAAAGVLAAAEVLPALASLRKPAQSTLSASVARAIEEPHVEMHPALYAMEGALCAADRGFIAGSPSQFAAQLEAMLTFARSRGLLPESRTGRGVERLDVVAQALRAAVLLGISIDDGSSCAHALTGMARMLAGCTRESGALPFSTSTTTPRYNAWCAMFAEQALCAAQPRPQARTLSQLVTLLV